MARVNTPNKNKLNTPSPRLFKISIAEEQSRVKDYTIKGIGLLSRNQTMEQGKYILEDLIPTLSKPTLSVFLPLLFNVKPTSTGKDNPEPRAMRAVIHILGEVVFQLPDQVTGFASKIIKHILSNLQNPCGSVEQMHEQCAKSLAKISCSIAPGPVIASLFQLYSSNKRLGENFFNLQNGASLCLLTVLQVKKVIEYLSEKEESLKKVITRLLTFLGNQIEYTPAPLLRVWYVILENIESAIPIINTYAPQLISNTIQALSSGSTTDSKKTFLAEKGNFWKNRAEAGKLLALIPIKLSVNICIQYANEVLNYLEQSKHDRIKQVRDEVSSAICGWKALVGQKTTPKSGTARMEFSSFSYSKDKKKTPQSAKKSRPPIKQFIKQKKSYSTSYTPDPVVLVPQTPSPHKNQNVEEKSTNIFSTDEPNISDIPSLSSIGDISFFSEDLSSPEKNEDSDSIYSDFDIVSLSDLQSPKQPKPKPKQRSPKPKQPSVSVYSPSKLQYESSPKPIPYLSELAPSSLIPDPIEVHYTPTYSNKVSSTSTRQNRNIKSHNNTNSPSEYTNTKGHSEDYKNLKKLIENQQEQINKLSKTIEKTILNTNEQTVNTNANIEMSNDKQEEIDHIEVKEDIKPRNEYSNDIFNDREGIKEKEWENIIETLNSDDDFLETTNVFTTVLKYGNENQCSYILRNYINIMESLSSEEFQLTFDILLYFIKLNKYNDITSLWLVNLLKVYTPLQKNQISSFISHCFHSK